MPKKSTPRRVPDKVTDSEPPVVTAKPELDSQTLKRILDAPHTTISASPDRDYVSTSEWMSSTGAKLKNTTFVFTPTNLRMLLLALVTVVEPVVILKFVGKSWECLLLAFAIPVVFGLMLRFMLPDK